MFPREVVIGVCLVSIQLLYSAVYPYAEQSLQHLPDLVHEVHQQLLSGFHAINDPATQPSGPANAGVSAAVDRERKGSKQPGKQKKKQKDKTGVLHDDDLLGQAVDKRMGPHMSSVVDAFKTGGSVQVSASSDADLSWDVHRITDAEVPWAYLFRVRVRNVSPRPFPLQGLARFYVLRAPDGLVFPIHRITTGPASFSLDPGEVYQYSWIFFTKYKTLEAAGGLLFENSALEGEALEQRLVNATLAPLEPAKAVGITTDKVGGLMNEYSFMGALDLRGVTYT